MGLVDASLCRDERYMLTYTPPCQPSAQPPAAAGSSKAAAQQQQQQQPSSGALLGSGSSGGINVSPSGRSSSGGREAPWWQQAWGQWVGSQQRGAVHVALRRDASHTDILQVSWAA